MAGLSLERVRDYGLHEIRVLPTNAKQSDLAEPRGNLLFFDSAPGETTFRIAVRPSGTEPKIKFYLFVRSQVLGAGLDEAKLKARQCYQAIQDDLLNWINLELEATRG